MRNPVRKIRFTDRTIDNLAEGSYGDAMLPAFCLRVGKRRKTFYTIRTGRVTTIGHYPVMSLADARSRARIILEGKYAPKRSITFDAAYAIYKDTHLKGYRPYTLYQTIRLIDRYCGKLKSKALDTIATQDVTNLYKGTAPSEANHLFGVLRTFFAWCEKHDHMPSNPISKLSKPYRETARDRLLTNDEIKAIWQSSEGLGEYGAIVRMLILSGQRKGQFGAFSQDYVKKDTVEWPGSAMKNGEKHVIPLTDDMRADIRRIPAYFISWGKPAGRLKEISGVDDFTLHDFRRYVSSTMRHLKVPIDVTEALLAHTAGSRSPIQRIYDRYDRLPEIREALKKYHRYLRSEVLEKRRVAA